MDNEIVLVYDKECPACDNYCQVVRIRDTVGQLRIINAREDTEIMQEITDAGFDIDKGMVLKLGGQFYYGADAIHALALISSRSGFFNRLNFWIFKSRPIARIVYPILAAGRLVLLKLLRKTRINNLGLRDTTGFNTWSVPGISRFTQTPKKPNVKLPPGSCDSHCHVFGPGRPLSLCGEQYLRARGCREGDAVSTSSVSRY